MNSGEKQNKASEVGMTKAHKSAGSKTIAAEEHVGSHGTGGVRFGMPKGVVDHSNVRAMKP